jgi:hypothetical protein
VSCQGNTTCFPSKTGVVSRGDQRVTSLRPARYTACLLWARLGNLLDKFKLL